MEKYEPHDCVPIKNKFRKLYVCALCGEVFAPVNKIQRELLEDLMKLCLRDDFPLTSAEGVVVWAELKLDNLK